MAADAATRRPRSPVSDEKRVTTATGSPSVSELSSVVADGSGSIRSTTGEETSNCANCNTAVFFHHHRIGDAPLLCRSCSVGLNNNEEEDDTNMSDMESLSSTTVDSLSDSDAESERSASITYYGDFGGEAVFDNTDWNVIASGDIHRTYASDSDDGGACPDIIEEEEKNTRRNLDSDVSLNPVFQLPKPPSDISLEEDVVAVALSDGEDILPDDSDSPLRVEMDELKSSSSSDRISDDDVVKVSLSDGEEVLAEEEVQEEEDITVALGMQRIPSWARKVGESSPTAAVGVPKKVVDHGSNGTATTPRRSRVSFVRNPRHCSRREILMERLRSVRTALQMVQVDTAAKSASAQLEAGEATRTEMSETKLKAKREVAALSATLDFLAKMALQKAIELEAFQEERHERPCAQ